jgi:hypothetical protein
MQGAASKLRARAASPSAAGATAHAAAEGADRMRWGSQTPTERQSSSFGCDAFFGLPFGAGVSFGKLVGCPLQLLGFLLYAAMLPPRFILQVVKAIFLFMTRAALQAMLAFALLITICILVAATFRFNLLDAIPGIIGFRIPQFFLPETFGMGGMAPAAAGAFSFALTLLVAALYFIPKLRALSNLALLLLLASWLQPASLQRSLAWCASVAGAASALLQFAATLAAANAPAILATLIAVLVVLYLLDFIGRLLYLCLWLLLFCPRFIVGFCLGISSSCQYALCALTLNYHPSHSW